MDKRDESEPTCWEIVMDEETGKPFWRGDGEKEGSQFDRWRPLILKPGYFPPGTRVILILANAPEFYESLFAKSPEEVE